MRSYDEMADNILRKYNDRLDRKKRRKAIIKRTSVSISGIGIAAATAVIFWNNNAVKQSIHTDMSSDVIVSQTETSTAEAQTSSENETVHTTSETESNIITSSAKTTSVPYDTSSTTVNSQQTTRSSAAVTLIPAKTGSSAPEAGTAGTSTAAQNTAVTGTTAIITLPAETTQIYEGSFYMKKLPAFLTALVTSVTVSPIIPDAADGELPIPVFAPKTIFEDGSLTQKSVKSIANGEFDIDINSDGKFDIFDCYALYRSVWNAGAPAEMREKCRQTADYNHDGIVDPLDCEMLVYYYGLFNEITPDIYDPDYYEGNCPDAYGPTDDYVDILKKYMDKVLLIRGITLDEYDPEDFAVVYDYKEIREDLDALKVGEAEPEYEQFTDYGAYDLPVFDYPEDYKNWADIFTDYLYSEYELIHVNYNMVKNSINNGTVDIDVDSDGIVDFDDIIDLTVYVKNNNGSFTWVDSAHEAPVTHTGSMVTLPGETEKKCEKAIHGFEELFGNKQMITMKDKFDYTFFDYLYAAFFETHPVLKEYTDYQYYYRNYYDNIGSYSIEYLVRMYLKYTGTSEKENVFNQTLFNKYFSEFVKAVESGEKDIPDINFDGKYDKWDLVDAHLYMAELFGGTTVDSGRTLSDELIQKIKTGFDLNGDGISGDIYDAMLAECCYLYIGVPADDEAAKAEFQEYKLGTYFAVLEKTDIERSGDANDDKAVNMSDAVIIMQSLANPGKYNLSEIGKIKGDICDTGDGITAKDAQTIQKKLLCLDVK